MRIEKVHHWFSVVCATSELMLLFIHQDAQGMGVLCPLASYMWGPWHNQQALQAISTDVILVCFRHVTSVTTVLFPRRLILLKNCVMIGARRYIRLSARSRLRDSQHSTWAWTSLALRSPLLSWLLCRSIIWTSQIGWWATTSILGSFHVHIYSSHVA